MMWLDTQPVWFMVSVALGALLIDRLFGEFLHRVHPVVLMGNLIGGFEKRFYSNTVFHGSLLVVWVLTFSIVTALVMTWAMMQLPLLFNLLISALLASTLLAHRMLYDSVKALLDTDDPNKAVAGLVSRDTADLSRSDCYKAGMESYAENLSDGVIAPLVYLLLLGLPGLVGYKAINTLDSMVGYRTERYERFGKVAARLDDLANWIPARLTAVLIRLLNGQWRAWDFYSQGRQHASPNAGHPITAMALTCGVRLGGPTVYFSQRVVKPWFGLGESPNQIHADHLRCALKLRNRIDLVLTGLILAALLTLILQ